MFCNKNDNTKCECVRNENYFYFDFSQALRSKIECRGSN